MIATTLDSTNALDGQPPWFATGTAGPAPRTTSPAPTTETSPARGPDVRAQHCVREMDQIHALIVWFDEEVMRKKSWAIAVWALVSAYGVQSANALVVLIGLAALLGFAASEMILRRYQCRYVVRAEQLETLLASGDSSDYRYSLATIARHSDCRRELKYAVVQLHFSLFYGFFAAISAASAVCLAL